MFSVIQVNRIYLIFNPVHFLVDSSESLCLINISSYRFVANNNAKIQSLLLSFIMCRMGGNISLKR